MHGPEDGSVGLGISEGVLVGLGVQVEVGVPVGVVVKVGVGVGVAGTAPALFKTNGMIILRQMTTVAVGVDVGCDAGKTV